ncbi:MAG: hypothetical protein SNJ82_06220 [Gemmataceae bacterium]
MRCLLCLVLLLAVSCEGTIGPIKRRSMDDTLIKPGSSIAEQEVQARDKLPFGDPSPAAGPRTYFDNPFSKSGR